MGEVVNQPQTCDLLVVNAFLITVDPERRVFADGAVAITGRFVLDVGRTGELKSRWLAERTLDAKGAIVHPGYVETHIHVNLHLGRNALAEPVTWDAQQAFYSAYWNALDDETEYIATKLACLELARGGATAFLECGDVFSPDAAAEAARSVGIRAFLGDPFIWDEGGFGGRDGKSPPLHRAPADLRRSLGLLGGQLHRNADPTDLVQGHVAVIGMGSASTELTLAAKEVARANGVVFNAHQSYGLLDAADDDARFGRHPLVHWAECGIVDDHTTFAHLNVVRDDEVDAITGSQLNVAWCPLACSMYGVAPTHQARHLQLHSRGVNLALGSDSPNFTGRFDPGSQAFAALMAAREQAGGPDALSAAIALEMGTINGARALGAAGRFGSIEAGKLADLVIRRDDIPEAVPFTDRVQNLVYSSRSVGVDTVITNGQVIVEHGKSTLVDEEEFYAAANQASARLMKKIGHVVTPTWRITP